MTIGTTMLGVAATGGFGLLAAVTYAGSGDTAKLDAPEATPRFTVISPRTRNDDDDGNNSWTIERTPLVFGTLPRAHASTGGS